MLIVLLVLLGIWIVALPLLIPSVLIAYPAWLRRRTMNRATGSARVGELVRLPNAPG